ncbi:MAG: M24 family metallopeptidase [Armatimonadota bacterium]
MNIYEEFEIKQNRAFEIMDDIGVDALMLTSVGNFAWITCGANNFVACGAENGNASAIITKNGGKYIVCDNIEFNRIIDEEAKELGFEVVSFPWHNPNEKFEVIKKNISHSNMASDIPMHNFIDASAKVDAKRQSLTLSEVERYKKLGKDVGKALTETAWIVEPGMSEIEISSILNHYIIAAGAWPLVSLIAADERIAQYRHPIPTDKKVKDIFMLVTGARRNGLIVSASRIVSFSEPSDEIRNKHNAVTYIDTVFNANSYIGNNISCVFKSGIEAYESMGYKDEWILHHQGGPTGYKGREFRATQDTDFTICENQAFAWNPSITGTKSEDTIISTSNGIDFISSDANWPKIEHQYNGKIYKRQDILII